MVNTWLAVARRREASKWLTREQMANLVVWSWVLPYFALTGAFLAKFNRYMSPLLPFVLLWGAWLIVALWRARGKWRVTRSAAIALATLGVLGGLLWSLAYVNGVYNGEHTWITASRWIYQNVPTGSKILWELWDDPLPKSLPGRARHGHGLDRTHEHRLESLRGGHGGQVRDPQTEVARGRLRRLQLQAHLR